MKQLLKSLKGIVMGVHITEINPHIPERTEIRVMSSVIPDDNPTFNNVWRDICAQSYDYQRNVRV